MSQIVIVAPSNGRYFRGCSFGLGVKCPWSSGARTLHEPGNPRKLENLIKRAMEESPGAIVIYSDVLLNSLPTQYPRWTFFRNHSPSFEFLNAINIEKHSIFLSKQLFWEIPISYFWKSWTFFSENFQYFCAIFAGIVSHDLTLFIQRFAMLIKYEQSPEEVAVHLRKIEAFSKKRGVSILTPIGKRPALPGQPEDDLHKACTKHEVSTLRAEHAREKLFQKDGVHVTVVNFEKPLRAALHHFVKRCTIERYIHFHCLLLTFELQQDFLRSKKSVNSIPIWPFIHCIHLF